MAYEQWDSPEEEARYNYGMPQPPEPPQTAPAPSPNPWGIPPNSTNPAGYMDLSYWMSRGVNPDQIFDENGQLRGSWQRTARGYEQSGAPPTNTAPVSPTPTTPYTYGDGVPTTYGGGGMDGGSGQFDYGRPMGNQFTPYTPFRAEKFSYGDFRPSTRTDLYDNEKNPGFAAAQQRLQKQIEGGSAYQGMLRSGMTFDRLGSILGNNEESQFKAFDDRNFRDWGANRENQFGAWSANTGMAERDNQRMNDFRFNTEKSTADDLLSRWQQLVQSTTQLAMPRG